MTEPVPVRRGGPYGAHAWPRSAELWHEPFREMEELWERMGQLFDPGWTTTRAGAWQPMVDMEETEDAYLFEVDLPGVRRDDIEVEVRDHDLWISGEIKERERTGVLRRQMRRTGRFSFRSTLPGGVDTGKVDATLENGVLMVRVPKTEKAKPHRVQIK